MTAARLIVGWLTLALIGAVLIGKWLSDWAGWWSRRHDHSKPWRCELPGCHLCAHKPTFEAWADGLGRP